MVNTYWNDPLMKEVSEREREHDNYFNESF